MLIHVMTELLRWSGNDEPLQLVYASYVQLVCQRLGQLLAQLHQNDTAVERQLFDELHTLREEELLRMILGPEATRRLLWNVNDTLRLGEVRKFLHRSILAE